MNSLILFLTAGGDDPSGPWPLRLFEYLKGILWGD